MHIAETQCPCRKWDEMSRMHDSAATQGRSMFDNNLGHQSHKLHQSFIHFPSALLFQFVFYHEACQVIVIALLITAEGCVCFRFD